MLKPTITITNENLSDKITQVGQEVERQIGAQDITTTGFVPGPILHQDSDEMTEEESAQFEADNPELMAFLQHLKYKLDNILKSG